tara:strand:+ start:368 stop:658 length:291 start_codon:yes stop_codon:yes gene_type:complete
MNRLREKYDNLKYIASNWKNKALSTVELLKEIQEENEYYKEEVSKLKLEINSIKINHEREILHKNSQIDRLTDRLTDYKERYQEIREDNKELRRKS